MNPTNDFSDFPIIPISGTDGGVGAAMLDVPMQEAVRLVFENTDLRPSTRKTYNLAIRHFLTWFEGHPFTGAVLVQYKNELRSRTDLAPKTKNLYLATVKSVFKQMHRLGYLKVDLAATVKTFQIGNSLKRDHITDAQVLRVFRYVRSRGDLRLLLVFNLLFRQGLRQKEVADLEVSHYDATANTLSILGKGRDDRELIHLHPETVNALESYLKEEGIRSGFLFPSRKLKGRHLGTPMIHKLVKDVHLECGVKNTPHAWRKVFTSKLIDAGMNLLDVQSYTRHKSLEQLKVYFDRQNHRKTLPTYYRTFRSTT